MVRHPRRITEEEVFSKLELPLGVIRRAAALNHRLIVVMTVVVMVMIASRPMVMTSRQHGATCAVLAAVAPPLVPATRAARQEALDALSVVL